MKAGPSTTHLSHGSLITRAGICAACLTAATFAQDGSLGLADILEQFQSVSSLHFAASADATLLTSAVCCVDIEVNTAIEGTMEYWAAGDMYRLKSYMDPAKYPGMDSQVAYDGQHFQLLLNSGSLLTFSAQDNASVVMMLPNPLLALLQFRYPLTDANAQFRLRLKDVINDVTPDEFWNVNWVIVEEAGRVFERAEFPGGTYEGQPYVHHVFVEPGTQNKLVRIDRVSSEGAVLTSAEFSHYVRIDTPTGPTFWPKSVILTTFDVQGNPVAKMSFVITELSLNAAIPQEIFTISTVGVQTIWDDDLQMFVQ